MSGITWSLTHVIALGFALTIRSPKGNIRLASLKFLVSAHRVTMAFGLTKLSEAEFLEAFTNLWEAIDNLETMHRRCLSDGLQKSVSSLVQPALRQRWMRITLGWTLTALLEDEEIEDLVACIPGLFDSSAAQDATSAILPLMSDQEWTNPVLGSRLYDLLKTYIPEASSLAEEKRKRRLRVCLKSLWYCGRAYNHPANLEPLPSYVCVFLSPVPGRLVEFRWSRTLLCVPSDVVSGPWSQRSFRPTSTFETVTGDLCAYRLSSGSRAARSCSGDVFAWPAGL